MRKLVTGPATEPLTSSEVKLFLKVDVATDDDLITIFIKAARESAENFMGRQLVSATWEEYLDEFPDVIDLLPCPVTSVTSIKYYDSDGTLQTLAASVYDADVVSEPARIAEAYGQSWPDTQERLNAVVVRYVAGYSSIPSTIKAGMLLHIGHLYENRQDVTVEKMNELPMGSRYLYDKYRVY